MVVKALIRLQVLTPLSTLVHIATILATQFIISPTLGEITTQLHRTSITPSPSLVGIFFLVLWGLQIGYCFLIVVAWWVLQLASQTNALTPFQGEKTRR